MITESEKEVYNLASNVYTYPAAKSACKEYKGELATKKQMEEALKNGANWCNYGWIKGQEAYYPIQGSFWSKLQKDPNLRTACGEVGLNGGYFKDTNLKFGVNCYGRKPPSPPKNYLHSNILDLVNPIMSEKKKKEKRYANIMPFNHLKKWSMNDADK